MGGTGDGLLSKIYKAHDNNDHLTKTHIKVKNARCCFSIEHFAGSVPYDTAWFLDKRTWTPCPRTWRRCWAAPRAAPPRSPLPCGLGSLL